MSTSRALRCVAPNSVIAGWDFSTGAVKCLAFDLRGQVLTEVRLPTDLWKGDPVEAGRSELNLLQLEGQVRGSVRKLAAQLRKLRRLEDWAAAGISATHHTSGRIDADQVQVRRAILWNDHTLATYHRRGLKRVGGQKRVQELIGGPWAIRYSLSHLVKDEEQLSVDDWQRTWRILGHGALAAGYLTGNFDVASISVGASTGIMDLRRRRWRKEMLEALADEQYRKLAWKQLPKLIDHYQPIGPLADALALEAGIDADHRPLIFPTSDDQQAGLVGGGAVDDGQLAIILGTSLVINSSSDQPPQRGSLDVMRLNWGPYLWMRCYNNGAGLLQKVFGPQPDFAKLEQQAHRVPPGCEGTSVLPLIDPEPSLKVTQSRFGWTPSEASNAGVKYRACLEALAYLAALAVREHERAGQKISRITVSGGIARSDLMCQILATVLDRQIQRLESEEGPALGAAVTALAALESSRRKQQGIDELYTVADAVAEMVKFRTPVEPNPAWREKYTAGLAEFRAAVR